MATYTAFGDKVKATSASCSSSSEAKNAGKKVAAYGAAAKGVTLMNYCGIRGHLVDYVVDKSPHKQNHFMPVCESQYIPRKSVRHQARLSAYLTLEPKKRD